MIMMGSRALKLHPERSIHAKRAYSLFLSAANRIGRESKG